MAEAAPLDRGAALFGRAELMLGLTFVGLANGFAARALASVTEQGWEAALFSTFDISAVVWIACYILLGLMHGAPKEPVRRLDYAVAALAVLAFLVPVGQASWLALTLLAAYLAATSLRGSDLRRAAVLLAAVSLPMLWARLLLTLFSGPLLGADAAAAAAVLGTQASGNTLPFMDGSGQLWIAPACSSLPNIALAILCMATFATVRRRVWSWHLAGWTALSCLVVTAINIARLAALALFPAAYDTLHGPAGGAAFSLLMLAAMVALSAVATREAGPHARAHLA